MIGDGATDLEACPPAVSTSYVIDCRVVPIIGSIIGKRRLLGNLILIDFNVSTSVVD